MQGMGGGGAHITVCIPTRNRPGSIAATLQSVAASSYQDFDVVVVDQSDDDITTRIVREFAFSDPRFRCLRSTSRGAARARNAALEAAQGPLIAFTDDDCMVDVDWLRNIVAHFAERPMVGQICGEVIAPPHDPDEIFVPTYRVPRLHLTQSPWMKWRERGISANMAFRLDVLQRVGSFDTLLGSGAPFLAGEDDDMTYRVLRAGYAVLRAPDVRVVHFGFRKVNDARGLVLAAGIGLGSAYMKHVRLGDSSALFVLVMESTRCLSWKWLVGLQKQTGLGYLRAYVRGARRSFRHTIADASRVYGEPAQPQSVPACPTTRAKVATDPPLGAGTGTVTSSGSWRKS